MSHAKWRYGVVSGMDQKHSLNGFNPKTKRRFIFTSVMSRGLENGWNSSDRIPYFYECLW